MCVCVCVFVCLVGLRLELRALFLQSRYCMTWATCLVHFSLFILGRESWQLFVWTSLVPWSSQFQALRLDFRPDTLHPSSFGYFWDKVSCYARANLDHDSPIGTSLNRGEDSPVPLHPAIGWDESLKLFFPRLNSNCEPSDPQFLSS
jgi:hypothetical protein